MRDGHVVLHVNGSGLAGVSVWANGMDDVRVAVGFPSCIEVPPSTGSELAGVLLGPPMVVSPRGSRVESTVDPVEQFPSHRFGNRSRWPAAGKAMVKSLDAPR
jgi:hypothetical protein